MRSLDQPDGTEEQLLSVDQASPETRQQVIRASFLRPTHLLVVAIGGGFFVQTLAWWAIPLTLVIYAVLVLLSARDALFSDYVLKRHENQPRMRPEAPKPRDVSPERRARWLLRGETRQKVEATLEVHRRTVVSIQESGDVVQAVLDDALPKLDGVAERLVDVAHTREKVASVIQDLKAGPDAPHREGGYTDLTELENELRTADAEISSTFEKLLALRARVVRASVDSEGATQEAAVKLNADLDEMNIRLDALHSTMSPPRSTEQ